MGRILLERDVIQKDALEGAVVHGVEPRKVVLYELVDRDLVLHMNASAEGGKVGMNPLKALFLGGIEMDDF